MIAKNEKQEICDFYDIGEINTWAPNTRGLVNQTLELDNRFFLTIHVRKTREQVEALALIANGMDDSIPITKPIEGKNGYTMPLNNGHILLNPRLQGSHYVGVAHTEKYPIPLGLHRSLAKFFWELQMKLSDVSEKLKKILKVSAVINIGQLPAEIPEMAKPLKKHFIESDPKDFTYPDLIHDDMERQNILNIGNRITGLVDLDSIRSGDILYEFGHFLFNFVLCDPNASLSTIDLYINELIKAGIIDAMDIPSLYSHIYQFVISDIIEFQDLTFKQTLDQHKKIDLRLLVQQYDKALSLASNFFRLEFAL